MYSLYGRTRRNPSKPTKKTAKKTSRRKIIVPTPSTPETRARQAERAKVSKVIGKLFSAGDKTNAMKLMRGKITVEKAKSILRSGR